MAAIYKSGTQWVVFGDAKFTLDSGSCIAVETADGTSLTLKLKATMEAILSVKYTAITNETGTAYTKDQVIALLQDFLRPQSRLACFTVERFNINLPQHRGIMVTQQAHQIGL